jgi:hypothetical protein
MRDDAEGELRRRHRGTVTELERAMVVIAWDLGRASEFQKIARRELESVGSCPELNVALSVGRESIPDILELSGCICKCH